MGTSRLTVNLARLWSVSEVNRRQRPDPYFLILFLLTTDSSNSRGLNDGDGALPFLQKRALGTARYGTDQKDIWIRTPQYFAINEWGRYCYDYSPYIS